MSGFDDAPAYLIACSLWRTVTAHLWNMWVHIFGECTALLIHQWTEMSALINPRERELRVMWGTQVNHIVNYDRSSAASMHLSVLNLYNMGVSCHYDSHNVRFL